MAINSHTMRRYQSGQSMIEYVVILAALTTALLAAGSGSIGWSKNDSESLMQAMHQRYTAQAYAISVTELPEGRDLTELSDYYNSLGKFPTLATKLQDPATTLTKATQAIATIEEGVDQLKQYTDPREAINSLDTDRIKDEIVDSVTDAIGLP